MGLQGREKGHWGSEVTSWAVAGVSSLFMLHFLNHHFPGPRVTAQRDRKQGLHIAVPESKVCVQGGPVLNPCSSWPLTLPAVIFPENTRKGSYRPQLFLLADQFLLYRMALITSVTNLTYFLSLFYLECMFQSLIFGPH